jgi:hypothetical protein
VRYGHRWDGDGLSGRSRCGRSELRPTWNVGKVELSVVNLLRVAAALGLDAPEGVKGLAQHLGDLAMCEDAARL